RGRARARTIIASGGRARVAPQVGERLSGRGETGWLARTQGGREPQRGWMPVRSTGEDSRPTEDNARSGLKNGVPAIPDCLSWGIETRKSPTAQDRSACLRLFETTSRRPDPPRPKICAAPVWGQGPPNRREQAARASPAGRPHKRVARRSRAGTRAKRFAQRRYGARGPQTGASRPPALLQRGGRISGSLGVAERGPAPRDLRSAGMGP